MANVKRKCFDFKAKFYYIILVSFVLFWVVVDFCFDFFFFGYLFVCLFSVCFVVFCLNLSYLSYHFSDA